MVRAAFARQYFHIIVGRFGTIAGLGAIEARTVQRHGVNVHLIGAAIIRSRPCVASIISRPLVANISAILGRNAQRCILLRGSEEARIRIELHFVNVALVIHVHDRGGVARDGLLLDGLRSEALIALGTRIRLFASRAGFRLALLEGVFIIVGVLLPVDDGIARIGLRRPGGFQRNIVGQRAAKRKGRAVQLPAFKRITGSGRIGRLLRRAGHELRRNIRAALRIERDPVSLGHNRRQRNIVIGNRHAAVGGNVKVAARPAGDALVGADMEGNVGGGNHIARLAFDGLDHAAVIVLEKDVIDFFKLGVDINRFGRRNRTDLAESNIPAPADKLLMRARSHLRLVERIALFDDLFAQERLELFFRIKSVGSILRSVLRSHRIQRRAVPNRKLAILFRQAERHRIRGRLFGLVALIGLRILSGRRGRGNSAFILGRNRRRFRRGRRRNERFREAVYGQRRKQHQKRQQPRQRLGQGSLHGNNLLTLPNCSARPRQPSRRMVLEHISSFYNITHPIG